MVEVGGVCGCGGMHGCGGMCGCVAGGHVWLWGDGHVWDTMRYRQ